MSTTTTDHPPARLRVGPARRAALLVAGLAALGGAIALTSPWIAALWLLPDLTLLAGWSREMGDSGRMAPRAVPYYNAAHVVWGPLVMMLAGAVLSPLVLALGLVWLSHVLIDRAMGYGLRTADGLQRG